MRDDCTGLLLPDERKSVEPRPLTQPARAAAKHQSLLHFVANAPDRVVKVRQTV